MRKKHQIVSVSLFLALSLLLCPLLGVSVGAYAPIATNELEQLTTLPAQDHLISLGLTASEEYGTKLNATQIADIGDIKYGISLIGIKESANLAHKVKAVSDGIWSTWQSGDNNELGNLSWTPSGKYYNVSGEEDAENGIYISLLTYNFGRLMDFEGFGYFTNNFNAMARAADIYSSNDGVNWTLVGKYDGNQKRMDGGEFTNATTSYKDSLDGTVNTRLVWSLEGTTAQYLRIAVVKGNGATGNGSYDSYSNMSNIAPREVVVFGRPNTELTPEQNTATKVAEYRGIQMTTGKNDQYYGVRFVGVIQDLIGSEVGFKITASFGDNRNENYDTPCEKVYLSIQGSDETGVREYTAQQLGGKYVYALSLNDIPTSAGKITFTVTAYKVIDSETFVGSSYEVVVNAGVVESQTPIQ